MATATSLPFAVTGEAVAQYTGCNSGRVLQLIETLLYVTVLTCCFQFRTHKCHTGAQGCYHQAPVSRAVGMKEPSFIEGLGQEPALLFRMPWAPGLEMAWNLEVCKSPPATLGNGTCINP